jgi:hypothetical protein
VHVPVVSRQQEASFLCNCQDHAQIWHQELSSLTFRDVLKLALPQIREKETQSPASIPVPTYLEVIEIFNATRSLATHGDSFKADDLVLNVFLSKHNSSQSLNIDPYEEGYEYLRLYLRWSIETVKIQYMDLYFMNIPISDRAITLSQIVEDFYRQIVTRLKYRSNPVFSVVSLKDNESLTLKWRFKTYREKYEKMDGPEWKLMLSEHEDPLLLQLKALLEERGINSEQLICPISQQLIVNPCFIRKCRHYFE